MGPAPGTAPDTGPGGAVRLIQARGPLGLIWGAVLGADRDQQPLALAEWGRTGLRFRVKSQGLWLPPGSVSSSGSFTRHTLLTEHRGHDCAPCSAPRVPCAVCRVPRTRSSD